MRKPVVNTTNGSMAAKTMSTVTGACAPATAATTADHSASALLFVVDDMTFSLAWRIPVLV
jgi:hypothetical protein